MGRGHGSLAREENVVRRLAPVLVLLLIPSGALYAQEQRPPGTATAIEATAGNDVLQLRYLAPSPLSFRSDLDYGFLLSQDRDIIGSAALMVPIDIHPVPGLTFEVGAQGYLADLNALQKTDIFAVAPGANVRYEIMRRWGLAAFGSIFYSPGVLTFGNADNLYDFTAGAEIRFMPRLTGLAGYRWLKFTTVGEPDVRVGNEVFAGLRWYPR